MYLQSPGDTFETMRQKLPFTLLIIFLVLAAVILVSGYLYYAQQKEQLKKEAGNNISSIAELKTREIVKWKKERLGDASVLMDNPLVVDAVRKISEGESGHESRQAILSVMQFLKKYYGYEDIYLLDRKGRPVVSTSDSREETGQDATDLATEAMKTKKIIFSELHRRKGLKDIHIDMIAPVFTTKGRTSQVYGAFLFYIDPSEFLFPLIQSWPVPSETAETLLVRKEDNDVLFLNELRHRKKTALNLRIPLSLQELPAAMAIRGTEGVVEGKDYRNIPVLAAVRAVPETPWFIVSKIDEREVFSALKKRAAFIGIIVCVLVLASGLVVLLLWRHQAAESYRKQYEAEHERQLYAERYEHLTKYANDIILLADSTGNIVDVNERAVGIYGYDRDEIVRLNIRDLRSPETKRLLNGQLKEVEEHNGMIFETQHQRKDGTVFPVEVSSRIIDLSGKQYYQSIIRDITKRKRAEKALHESEEQFRAMFEVASIGIAQADIRTGQWIRVNQKMCEITGYSADEMLKMRIPEITHPEDRQRDWEAFQQVVHGETPDYRLEKRYLRKDGSLVWVNVNMTVIRDPDGQPVRSIATIEDISERKRIEEKLHYHEALLKETGELAKVGGWEFDAISFKGTWTEEVARIHDLEPDVETNAELGLSFYQGEYRIAIEKAVKEAIELGKPYDLELAMVTAKGNHKWVRTIGYPIMDNGKVVKVRGSFQDITERKQKEEEIRKLNAELEQRVSDRTSQLEAANKEREAFAYSVSHDLRAPLRAIDGFSKFVLEDYADRLDDEGKRLLKIIRTNTQKMDQLITDILGLSRVSRTEMRWTRIDMTTLVNSVYQELAPPEIQEKFVFSVSALPDAFGDPVLILQVWDNLIANAMKYTMPKKERRIEIGGRVENGMNIYYIRDTGVGFNPDYTHKLFSLFQRLHSEKDFEGTGVGLAIVQRVIFRHGGKVWAEGKVNEGATFWFSIPTKTVVSDE
jgi:PAS domain S-box-containing protein